MSTSSSGAGWGGIPDTPVMDILRDFGRYFIGERFADGFAQGLLALERNWVGPLATNAGVDTTLAAVSGRWSAPRRRRCWRTGASSRPSIAPITITTIALA